MSKIKFVLTYDDWNRACETMRQQGNGTSNDELARITTKIIQLIISQISIISHNSTITDEETKKRIQSILHERIFHALPPLKKPATLDDCAFWIIDCLHQDELIICVDSESLEVDDHNTIDGSNLLIVTNASSTILTDEYWANRDFKASHVVSAGPGSTNGNAKSNDDQDAHIENLAAFMSKKDDECDTLLALCSQGIIGRIYSGSERGTADVEDHTYLVNLTNAPDASSWLLSSSAAPAILKTSEILSVQQVMRTIQTHLASNQKHVSDIEDMKAGDERAGKDAEGGSATSQEKVDNHTAVSSDNRSTRSDVTNNAQHNDDYLVLLDTDYF